VVTSCSWSRMAAGANVAAVDRPVLGADPALTVFGAKVPMRSGWDEVSETLRWLAARWSDCTDYSFDLVAADVSGDLAYIIGFEHVANSVIGVPVDSYTLRVTHIFRREQGVWKIAHRHAAYVPIDQTLAGEALTT